MPTESHPFSAQSILFTPYTSPKGGAITSPILQLKKLRLGQGKIQTGGPQILSFCQLFLLLVVTLFIHSEISTLLRGLLQQTGGGDMPLPDSLGLHCWQLFETDPARTAGGVHSREGMLSPLS